LLKILRASSCSATIEAIVDRMIQAEFSAEYKRVLLREIKEETRQCCYGLVAFDEKWTCKTADRMNTT